MVRQEEREKKGKVSKKGWNGRNGRNGKIKVFHMRSEKFEKKCFI